MTARTHTQATIAAFATGGAIMAVMPSAWAVPSYARQTGESCMACHTAFPQLTAFGRQFKLHGYTMTGGGKTSNGVAAFPPLSAMLQVSSTSLSKAQPDTQNDNTQFPEEFSLFYAGRITDKMGAFIQATYDGVEDHFGMDNADIRYANDTTLGGKDLTWGLTLNNNPTVEDLWNSTPAWSFPFAASGVAPSPAAAAQVDGTLGQEVAGLGAYGLWNDTLYGQIGFYRSAQLGSSPPDSQSEDVIDNVAPYWRLALQRDSGKHSFEIGTFGLNADLFPGAGTPLAGATNDFRDIGVDGQYQYQSGGNSLTLRTSWIREKQDWNASFAAGETANPSDTLKTFRINGSYLRNHRLGGSLGYFATSGDGDPLLYPAESVDGSRTGKPDSNGWLAELDYLPWENTRFALQYTAYDKFNGASSNYDGFGRDASDNDTLYLNAWFMF